MPLTTAQCQAFNSYLGTRPYDWDKKISKDRKPSDYLYTTMYKMDTWKNYTGTTHLHERTYVTRPNDPSIWNQFTADPCIGTPCTQARQYIGHGVDQLRYDEYSREYQTPVFCLDQLNTIEEGIQKMAQIAEGYQLLPEMIASDFLRLLTLRKAGTVATSSGLFMSGFQDSNGNPVALDISDDMFSVSQGQATVQSTNTLLINLNAHAGLTAQGITTTALLSAAMGQLTMEYLNNMQVDLAANGYHDRNWLQEGKFSITTDYDTRRRLLAANPALTQMYSSADFAKGGAFYSVGISAGCGDWLFKLDKEQMRFRFRSDLDGLNFSGGGLTNAIWIEQVWPFQNVAATYGKKPVFSADWKNAPIRLFHAYNREARTVYVGEVTSINDQMKFGLARSLMGEWKWKSPDYFQATDPNTGAVCSYQNDKGNMGYWLGEFRMAEKTVYPECERLILALGEAQPYIRVPRTNTAPLAPTVSDYVQGTAYNEACGTSTGYNEDGSWQGWAYPVED